MMKDGINIRELKNILNYLIDNNSLLATNNKKTSSIEIIGESGMGKTSVATQIAEERGMDCVKLNLTQLDELGDLIGFPIKEYQVCEPRKEGSEDPSKCIWIAEDLLHSYSDLGYTVVIETEPRMGYAMPSWVPKTHNENGGVLILDDWNRADPRFIQAVMELIDRGEYLSWSLPVNWSIILTANPSTGDYNVSSIDNAQRTRYISFDLEFDKDCWAEWAEEEGIDGRCIDFILCHPEVMEKVEGVQTINARSLVTFFNAISGLDNFNTEESLYKILLIAKGSFSSGEDIVGRLFSMFINNQLDKLVQPEDMLNKDWTLLTKDIKECVFPGSNYRADIAAVITTRFINYIKLYFDKKGSNTSLVTDRILEIVEHDKELLAKDLIFQLIKSLVGNYPARTNALMMNPSIIKNIMS